VGAGAVELDDQLVVGPDAVAGEALDDVVPARARDGVGVEEGEEEAFEMVPADVAGGGEPSEGGGPSSSRVAGDESIEGSQVGVLLVLGLVESVLEVLRREDGREVEQRAGDGGDGDAVAGGDLVGLEGRPVGGDARAPALPRRRHFGAGPLAQPPQRTRRAMAQHRAGPGGEDGGHPPPSLRQPSMPHRVDAPVHLVQPADREHPRDRVVAHLELRSSDDAVLPLGETRGHLAAHSAVK
jgi:hypothetical protein